MTKALDILTTAGIEPYYYDGAADCAIVHGDCREVPLLADVKLVLTDPPYGVNLGNHKSLRDRCTLAKESYLSYEDTVANFQDGVVPTINSLVVEVGRAVVFSAATHMWCFRAPDAVGGIYLPAGCGRGKWGFTNFAHCLFYGTNPNTRYGSQHTVLSSTETAEKTDHPCPKPIGWMTWLVKLASLEGETILDPFAGSCTTAVAAKRLGRSCICIELEEKYCAIGKRRLQNEPMPLFVQPEPMEVQAELFKASSQ